MISAKSARRAFPGCAFSTEEGSRSASVFDRLIWIATLRRLLDLEIEILVEGHGFVHTMRRQVPDIPGLVIRRHPREELLEKAAALRVAARASRIGTPEGLPLRAVEVSCFR
jgi:hypothetical protein